MSRLIVFVAIVASAAAASPTLPGINLKGATGDCKLERDANGIVQSSCDLEYAGEKLSEIIAKVNQVHTYLFSAAPTVSPTVSPTAYPTASPTVSPTASPTASFSPSQKLCQCVAAGCECTTTFTGLPAGKSCSFTMTVQQSDYNGSGEKVEWVNANNALVSSSEGCFGNHDGGGSQGQLSTWKNCPISAVTVPSNGQVQFKAKVHSSVDCCSGTYQLDAKINSVSCS